MDFDSDPAIETYRSEARAFIGSLMNDEVRERVRSSGTQHDWEVHRALAATGVIADGIGSATRSGRDPLELFVLFDELGRASAPSYGLANTMLVSGVLEHVGSPFLREQVLPALHGGEAIVALGYTEPDCGSDLAAISTRVVRNPDGTWLLNGQKMFTSLAHEATYVFLLTRSNLDVKPHRGMTIFLVPLSLSGIEVQPIFTFGGDRTNVTFYSNVQVDDKWRVGEVDGGWDVMRIALTYERGVLGNTNQGVSLLEETARWAMQTRRGGERVLDDSTVRVRLAEIAIDNEMVALLSLRAALIASAGGEPAIEGAEAKLFASECYVKASELCSQIAGRDGLIDSHAAGSVAGGWVNHAAMDSPLTTIYGGTSEIQKNLIAERHLGLPRAR
jgi:alkylation response protein AidB-like acyl-CoA dehydrogenase